mmetsp:Transcript_17222/g.36455  ORF Transcript_17222/g.36455 Transcript_17222/m.36455 type:complete len:502 (+) Transcript_17222:36-1541(+)
MEAAYTPHQVTLASPATVEARGGKRRVAPEGETPSAKEKRIEQQAYALGVQFMIFRLRVDDGWVSCEGGTPGHIADSVHHRYQRLVGFKQVNQEAIDADARATQAYRDMQTDPDVARAHEQRVYRLSLFERYVQERHAESAYVAFLNQLKVECISLSNGVAPRRINFMRPPDELLTTYMMNLRKDQLMPTVHGPNPDHSANTIKAYLGALTAACDEFSAVKGGSVCTSQMAAKIKLWKDDDAVDGAVPFDPVTAFPALWEAVFTMSYWSMQKCIKAWTMFLIAFAMMGRASCITKNCPTYEDLVLPGKKQWDPDGFPQWIELGLRDWKCRTAANRGKRYALRLHRNHQDPRFCPVSWLIIYLIQFSIADSPHTTQGKYGRPIFQKEVNGVPTGDYMTTDMWTAITDRMFAKTKLYDLEKKTGCTNHSIRRSAAQWAGRCGARELDVRNNGRWKTMELLALYMGQGPIAMAKALEEHDFDPIEKIWWYQAATIAGINGLDQM